MTPLRKQMLEDMQLKGYSPATQKAYVESVKRMARAHGKSPERITEAELRTYLLGLRKEIAPASLRVVVPAIRFLFTVTLRRQWPVLELVRPPKESSLPVVLSRQEVRSILQRVRAPVYRVCLGTIYSCGLRVSEGAHLRCEDVDSQRMFLRVRGKGNKVRQVPLPEATLQSLRELWKMHRSEPWLCPARLQPHSRREEGPVAICNVQNAFAAARLVSGVNKAAHVHTLRHSYATHLMEAGVQLRVIQEILGHRSPRTTAIYTHLTSEVLAQVKAPIEQLAKNL